MMTKEDEERGIRGINNEARKPDEGSRNGEMYKTLPCALPVFEVEAISLATIF